MWRDVKIFIQKDIKLELRNKYSIGGIVLYLFSSVFVLYISFVEVDDRQWNNLFWVIMLFVSVNTLTKSFLQESGRQQLYHYSISAPLALFISKMIYNTILIWLLSAACFGLMNMIFSSPVEDTGLFTTGVLLGGLGISIALTFISLIAIQARHSHTILAVLGFPVLIPILATAIQATWHSIEVPIEKSIGNLTILLSVDLILVAVGLILFPIIWRN